MAAGPYGLHCTEWDEHIEDESVATECEAFTPTAVRTSGMEKTMTVAKRGYSRVIDGIPVDKNLGRVSGRFELTDHDASSVLFDDEIMLVIMGRVSAPTYADGKGGEIHRVNVIKPHEARLISGEKEILKMLEDLGFDQRPQPSLFDQPTEVTVGDVSPISFDTPVSEVEVEIRTDPVEDDDSNEEDFFVEGESEPEPVYTGTSDDEESEWTAEDEAEALALLLEESEPVRLPKKDEAGRAVLQQFLQGDWN